MQPVEAPGAERPCTYRNAAYPTASCASYVDVTDYRHGSAWCAAVCLTDQSAARSHDHSQASQRVQDDVYIISSRLHSKLTKDNRRITKMTASLYEEAAKELPRPKARRRALPRLASLT